MSAMGSISPLPEPSLRGLLRELERAEAVEDAPRSDAVLDRLFREHLGPRLRDTRMQLHELDLDLLDRKAARAYRAGLYPQALLDHQVAIDAATRSQDTRRLLRAHLGAASAYLALLDFAAAERHIGSAEKTDGPPPDVTVLRARLEAARGCFAMADALLAEVLADAVGRSEQTGRWALQLAEIRIDRGDFAGFEQIRSVHAADDPALDTAWTLLAGTVLAAQGRLSAAIECHRAVLKAERVEDDLLYAARWYLIQALVTLNRLDEAEAELSRLRAMDRGGHDLRAQRLLSAWIDARRGTRIDDRVVDDPMAAHELVCCLPGVAVVGVRQLRTRWRERLAEECAHLTTCALLRLQDGDQADAAKFLEWLAQRTRACESPLLQARHSLAAALLAHARGDFPEAARAAEGAALVYRALGMPIQEWGALRVQSWCAANHPVAGPDRLAALQGQCNDILTKIVAGLEARDAVYFRLSKSSAADERRSQYCRDCARGILAADEALQAIAAMRLWGSFRDTQQPEAETRTGVLAIQDVYSLARCQSALWEDAPTLPRRMTRVAPSWLPHDTAVAHYIVLPDRIELFVITREGVRRVLLPATGRAELWPLLRSAHRYLKNQGWSPDARVLGELSRRLGIDHLAALPAHIRRLSIIPDGALANAPFGALVSAGKPLFERFVVASTPRWSWTTRRRDVGGIRRELAIAVDASQAEPGDHYMPLPEVARALADLPPAHGRRRVLLGAEANLPSVLAELTAAELVLFVGHGRFDPEQPARSGVLLADAWLTLEHLASVRVPRLRLAVLAACEVGDTVPLPGAEALGLPGALLLRGAAAVAMPLWRVPPGETVAFITELFAAMKNCDPAEALSLTRRQMYAERRDPRVWAAFEIQTHGLDANWWGKLRLRLPW